MIAMRRLMILGWGVEAGLRVRVVHPSSTPERQSRSLTTAQRSAAEAAMRKRADQIRSDAALRWFEIGGR